MSTSTPDWPDDDDRWPPDGQYDSRSDLGPRYPTPKRRSYAQLRRLSATRAVLTRLIEGKDGEPLGVEEIEMEPALGGLGWVRREP